MKTQTLCRFLLFNTVCLSLLFLSIDPAYAIPAFARQTNMPCTACHNGNFPALNQFGRQFKLSGYVLSAITKVTQESNENSSSELSLVGIPPMSAMLQISSTHTKTPLADKQNDGVMFPDQLSLFFGGAITSDVGIFSQLTYAQGDTGFSIDNTDIRAAKTDTVANHSLIFGATLNNNPTVEDLWNSTPAWGYPWASSAKSNTPAAGPFIESLGGNVAGLGAYAMLDNTYYGNLSFYRSTDNNNSVDSQNVIKGGAPYWRLAWQHYFGSSYLMVGTYGMYASVYPTALATDSGLGITGPSSRYFDRALDFQYELPLSDQNNSLLVHGSYTDEGRKDLAADGTYSEGQNGRWRTAKIDAAINVASRFRPVVAWFNTTTGADNLNNSGYIGELSFYPWENLNLSLQYTGYTKFDGSTEHASDNNSLYLLAWLVI